MKKIKYIIKLLYVINHIIFRFFHNFNKVDIKNQTRQTFGDRRSIMNSPPCPFHQI
jgi:hypothetical protein